MTRSAPQASRAGFEAFLVEDVILTLGNLRGALGWLGGGSLADRACLDRLDRQLALLDDRARQLARALCAEAAAAEPANIFAIPVADAVFRSRRPLAARVQAERPIADVVNRSAATSASIAHARASSSTSK